MTVAYHTDGHDFPPRGARGAEGPEVHEAYKIDVDGNRVETVQTGQVELAPGERIVEAGGGGGGYGPAGERDPERVRRDVEAGLVSQSRAREAYLVEVVRDGSAWVVDRSATARLRRDYAPQG
jgi:N-methylhydantoinase B